MRPHDLQHPKRLPALKLIRIVRVLAASSNSSDATNHGSEIPRADSKSLAVMDSLFKVDQNGHSLPTQISREPFIQYGLSALSGASLISPAQSWPLPDPALNPFTSSSAVVPPTVAKACTDVPKIKVIGVGGGGCKAAVHMIDRGVTGIEFIFANTDVNALNRCVDHQTIQLHRKTLRAKTKLDRCRETAELAANEIRSALAGTHLLFITVGLGGGTGTEAAPVIARIAKDMDMETVALVTMPFSWEGVRRMRYANSGLAE